MNIYDADQPLFLPSAGEIYSYTTLPDDPSNGDLIYYNQLRALYFYDQDISRWLSSQLYSFQLFFSSFQYSNSQLRYKGIISQTDRGFTLETGFAVEQVIIQRSGSDFAPLDTTFSLRVGASTVSQYIVTETPRLQKFIENPRILISDRENISGNLITASPAGDTFGQGIRMNLIGRKAIRK